MVKIEFTPLSLDRKIFPFKKGFKKPYLGLEMGGVLGGTLLGGTTVLFITGNSKYNNEVQEEGAKFGDIRIGYSLDEGTVFLWPKTQFIEI